jgi:hypothetical protein
MALDLTWIYVFKGPTYHAQQKFVKFMEKIQTLTELWSILQMKKQTSEYLTLDRVPGWNNS